MNLYTLGFADSIKHAPKNPERTAKRAAGYDVQFRVFRSRDALAKFIRKQQDKPPHYTNLTAVIPLTDGEGY